MTKAVKQLLLVVTVVAALLAWAFFQIIGIPAMVLVIVLPVIAYVLSRVLVEGTFAGFTWLSNRPLAEWEGNYHEFAGVQVRVFDEGGQLWFAAPDVINAAGIEARADRLLAVYPGGAKVVERLPCLNMATLEKFLAAHRSPEAGRLLLWAQREVAGPWEKKTPVS